MRAFHRGAQSSPAGSKARSVDPRGDAPRARGVMPGDRDPARMACLRWMLWATLVVGVATATAAGLLLLALPSVDGTQARVVSQLDSHGATYDPHVVPSRLADAAVAVEDRRFYRHHGVDGWGVARAVWGEVVGGHDRGGSTITQQLAKQLYTPAEHGVTAKVEQVGLAVKLERRFPKTKILELYLNTGYFGHGYWGASAAAHGYFGEEPVQLDWAEAALMAGLLQSPSGYDPYRFPDRARARQHHVLDRLVASGKLSARSASAARREPVTLVGASAVGAP